MAKKKRRGRPPGSKNRVVKGAETVGGALGGVMAKVDAWMAQREEIAHELRNAADKIMSGENPFGWRAQGWESSGLRATTGRRKRRTMSAAARKAIGDAQRARWAKQKKASKRGHKKGGKDSGGAVGNA